MIQSKVNPYIYVGLMENKNRTTAKLINFWIKDRSDVELLESLISDYFQLPYSLSSIKTRKEPFMTAKHLFRYFLHFYSKFSLGKIGLYDSGRDHSTVIHSIQTVQDLCSSDEDYKKKVKELNVLIRDKFGFSDSRIVF